MSSEAQTVEGLAAAGRKGAAAQPISRVRWVPRDSIRPNDYNPNCQPPPEFRLLKVSIMQDGWTQPIVAFDAQDGAKPVIVDGEHRWKTSADPEVAAMTGGLVPVVFISGDAAHRMMSTIRHNRARGEHGVLPMAEIVKALLGGGTEPGEIQTLLQMEAEEVERLAERAGMPTQVARDKAAFSDGWVPGPG